MSILKHKTTELDKYSFLVVDTTTQQEYADAGIDLSGGSVTAAILTLINTYDDSEYQIDILADWDFLLDDGITVNIADLPPDGKVSGLDFFGDYVYRTRIDYTYLGTPEEDEFTAGFRAVITNTVQQQLLAVDWKKELSCTCNCNSVSARKLSLKTELAFAADQFLEEEYISILAALYVLTGTVNELTEQPLP